MDHRDGKSLGSGTCARRRSRNAATTLVTMIRIGEANQLSELISPSSAMNLGNPSRGESVTIIEKRK